MTFRIGQRVVCINGVFIDKRWYHCETQPREGEIYTIRGFPPQNYMTPPDTEPLYYLEEIVNTPVLWESGVFELAWPHRRFRPLVERKTDISIFTKMLDTAKTPQFDICQ